MTTETIDRTQFLGGSDLAGVLGLSRWETPLSVWSKKTGLIPEKQLDNEAAELGTYLEEYIARRFSKATGKAVMRKTERATHPKYPHFKAQIDRLVVNEDAILECKSTGERHEKEWEDGQAPAEYLCQVQWQLACTGKKKAYLAVLIGNRKFKWQEIQRDPVMIAEMLKRANHFWNNYVITQVMPGQITAQDTDTLNALFPQADIGAEIQLDDESVKLIESRNALYQDLIQLEKQVDTIENQLKAKVKENEIGIAGNYRIFWKNVARKAYEVPASTYRKFSIKETKGE